MLPPCGLLTCQSHGEAKTYWVYVYRNKEAMGHFSTYFYTTGCLFVTDGRELMIIRKKSDLSHFSITSARFCKKEKKCQFFGANSYILTKISRKTMKNVIYAFVNVVKLLLLKKLCLYFISSLSVCAKTTYTRTLYSLQRVMAKTMNHSGAISLPTSLLWPSFLLVSVIQHCHSTLI